MLRCLEIIKGRIFRFLAIKVALKHFVYGIILINIFWIYLTISKESSISLHKIGNNEFYSNIYRASAYNATRSHDRNFRNTSQRNLRKKIEVYNYHLNSSADKRTRTFQHSNSSQGTLNRKMAVHLIHNDSSARAPQNQGSFNRRMVAKSYHKKSSAYKYKRARAQNNQGNFNRKMVFYSYNNRSSANDLKRVLARLPHHSKNSRSYGLQGLDREKVRRNYINDKRAKHGFANREYRRKKIKNSLRLHNRVYKDEPPMLRILHSLGQNFGKYVSDSKFLELHDFRKYITPKYLDRFKNPCLIKNVPVYGYNRTQTTPRRKLRCVPYFIIAGFPKCGTTDLWFRLRQHPEVVWRHVKEVNFFHKKQYNFLSVQEAVNDYQNSLRTSATNIIKTCVMKKNWTTPVPCITGDASVDTIFDNKFWKSMPGNENLTEPAFTNANYVHKVNPNMKVIILVRDPVERLYSDYLFMSNIGYTPDPSEFHNIVLNRIHAFNTCRKNQTVRACTYDVYDDWNMQTYMVRLTIGIYHVFLSDWLQVFPKSNIMVVKSENTKGTNKYATMSEVFRFLGLRVPSTAYLEQSYNSTTYRNERRVDSKKMFPETRTILQEFYKEFNRELEKLFPHLHY